MLGRVLEIERPRAEGLLAGAAVALEALAEVLAQLGYVHFRRLRRVLQLLKRDVLRVAVIGFRLVAATRDAHTRASLPDSARGSLVGAAARAGAIAKNHTTAPG